MMTFEQAATLVASESRQVAFAFYPAVEQGALNGGTLFILHRPESDDVDGWTLDALVGRFTDDAVETYSISPRDCKDLIPAAVFGVDPRHLRYAACDEEIAMSASWCDLRVALAMVNGIEESIADKINLANPSTLPAAWGDWLLVHVPESAFRDAEG